MYSADVVAWRKVLGEHDFLPPAAPGCGPSTRTASDLTKSTVDSYHRKSQDRRPTTMLAYD